MWDGVCGVAGLSLGPDIHATGEVGGDFSFRMLPELLLGRGGGGSPADRPGRSRESPEVRLEPGKLMLLLACSSYSRAARKLGEIIIGREFVRVRSFDSL